MPLDRYAATNPKLFGSVARGTACPESDIDILVDIVRDVVETHLPPLAEALRGHLAADRSAPTSGVVSG